MRLEEGADHNQNPIRGARQGHRQFFERTSTLHRVGYNRLTSLYGSTPSASTVRFNRPLQPSASTNRPRARAACFPRFRRPIVGTKAVIQNSHPVGGKQQATFAGYFDRLDSFIEAIRHSLTSITSLYKPSTFHLIEAVRRRASSNYNASRYTTGLNPTAYTARTTRTVRRRPRITTRVVTPRGWHHDSDSRRVPNPGLAPRQ